MNNKDFGEGYFDFFPTTMGRNKYGKQDESTVCLDGHYTAEQLRNIADELDRLEYENDHPHTEGV